MADGKPLIREILVYIYSPLMEHSNILHYNDPIELVGFKETRNYEIAFALRTRYTVNEKLLKT